MDKRIEDMWIFQMTYTVCVNRARQILQKEISRLKEDNEDASKKDAKLSTR